MKTDFTPFKIGTVFNPLRQVIGPVTTSCKTIEIKYPSRLNAMAIDPSKITSNKNLVYTPGEVVFAVKIYKTIKVELLSTKNSLEIDPNSKRAPLIEHAYLLMKNALKFDNGIKITVDNSQEIRHAGLGSSGGLIAGVASAINELFGNPISPSNLIQYLAQNHGEEIDGDSKNLNPVQCIGGSAAAGLFKGGLLILAGESRVIATMNISNTYKVVIGIPKDYIEFDSKILLEKEMTNFDKFMETGKTFGPTLAYNLLHYGLPSMVGGDLKPIGKIIFDYRFNMGSIKNCSYCYPQMVDLASKLAPLFLNGNADVLALSSVGPAFFAITKKQDMCASLFEKNNLNTIITDLENGTYTIINKQ